MTHYRAPYTGEQLRFFRWLPPHMRPSMLEKRKWRGKIAVKQVLIATLLMAVPMGLMFGYFGTFL